MNGAPTKEVTLEKARGRSADVLSFPTEGSGRVSIPPLALEVDQSELKHLLASHGPDQVTIQCAHEPPGGKYRTVIPLG